VHTYLITENSDVCAVKITIFYYCQTFLDRGIVLAGAFRDVMDKIIARREPTVCLKNAETWIFIDGLKFEIL